MPHEAIDWSERYRTGNTPWDVGAAHPELAARLAAPDASVRTPRPGARAFVGGCGRGHDALALARAGWSVVAADSAPEVEPLVAPPLAALGGRFVVGDALAFEDERAYELVFEHTFFCAIDPARRADWGALASRLLVPGGRLVALVFPFDRPDELAGPPWRTSAALLGDALGADFALREDVPVAHRVERREWQERWVVFERTQEP